MATYIQVMNLKKEMEKDFIIGKGLHIYDRTFSTKKEVGKKTEDGRGKKEKNYHGLQSTFFSTSWEDGDEAFSERFSCKCGHMQGGIYEGEICPLCNNKVIFVDIDMTKFGWLIINEFEIINPSAYFKIQAFVGKEAMYIITGTDFVETKKVPSQFIGIGIIGFKTHFNEIIEFAYRKKKKKVLEYNEIKEMQRRHAIFTNAIPVITNILRPYSISNMTLRYSVLDKKYEPMRTAVESLNRMIAHALGDPEEKIEYLNKKLRSIQKLYNELYAKMFEMINGKDAHIRDQLLGGRINFSSRNVIVSDEYLRANEITLSYHAFLELYRYEIIGILSEMNDTGLNEAIEEVSYGKISYSKKLHTLMNHMIERSDCRVLVNRNPTIDYGSILMMKIKAVTYTSANDFTMSIPIQSLTPFNADMKMSGVPVMVYLAMGERLTSGVGLIAC